MSFHAVVRRAALHHVAPLCGTTGAKTSAAAASPLTFFGGFGGRRFGTETILVSVRCISWNPANWVGNSPVGRESHRQIEDELPDVFAQQPQEVDDFIRPEKSVFERLEDFWDWIVSFMQPVEKQLEVMRSLRHSGFLGFDFGTWGNVFFSTVSSCDCAPLCPPFTATETRYG
ncbi:preprotein translocase subunit YidC [Trypanosoma cruzi]|nr:preprotein translocase subunit YidC [Trypanosoma cruzi]